MSQTHDLKNGWPDPEGCLEEGVSDTKTHEAWQEITGCTHKECEGRLRLVAQMAK